MTALANLPFLLFCLGALMAIGGHRVSMPAEASSWLGTLLVVLLGLKGGIGLSSSGKFGAVALALSAGLIGAILVPLLCRPVLQRMRTWGREEAALAAGHYGSVSVATFLAMFSYLQAQDIRANDYMITVMAIMEAPALIVALIMAQRAGQQNVGMATATKAAMINPPLLLLIGAMIVGAIIHTNPGAEADTKAVLLWIPGLLSIYLLLLGQKAGTLLRKGGVTAQDVTFAAITPLLAGALGIALGTLFGLPPGDKALLTILIGSASYIVAPAVLSQVMPHVDLDRTQVMVIGVTFPVNLLVAIPLWTALATALAG